MKQPETFQMEIDLDYELTSRQHFSLQEKVISEVNFFVEKEKLHQPFDLEFFEMATTSYRKRVCVRLKAFRKTEEELRREQIEHLIYSLETIQ